jgi:hypothetical protein
VDSVMDQLLETDFVVAEKGPVIDAWTSPGA